MKTSCITEILKDIIAIDTQVNKSNSMQLIEYIMDIIEPFNFKYDIYRANSNKCNLIIKLTNPGCRGNIVLNGHLDTKPTGDRNKWVYDPFEVTELDGKIYGVGASDMKGGIASMIALLKYLGETKIEPKYNLEFHFVDDEENNSEFGLKYLIKHNLINSKIDMAIICEPTSNSLVLNSLGNTWKKIKIFGKQVHAGHYFEGINANDKLVELLYKTNEKIKKLQNKDHVFPQFPNLNIGILKGGFHPGTVPGDSEAIVDIRVSQEEHKEEILNILFEVAKNNNITIDITDYMPGMSPFNYNRIITDFSDVIIKQIEKIYLEQCGSELKYDIFFGGSDAGDYVQKLKIPAIVFGPGDLQQAHQPNEWIEIKSLEEHYTVLREVLCG